MKKNVKKSLIIIVTALILTLVLSLSGCAQTSYQMAVANGYTGTYEEYLDVLANKQTTSGTSAIDQMYNKAVESGYNGTFEDWMVATFGSTSQDNQIKKAANKGLTSAVTIYSTFTSAGGRLGSVSGSYSTAGSGVIFYEDDSFAYIITNYHVIYEKSSIEGISNSVKVMLYGRFYSGMEYSATVVGGSSSNDIAVVKIAKDANYIASAAQPVTVGNSLAVTPGDVAIAIGNPNAEGVSVTSGIVSVESEEITMTSVDGTSMVDLRVIRIDTPINSGNSGGGLFDSNGNLIGIVNAKYSSSDTENIGYAIPSSIAVNLAYRIIEQSAKNAQLYKVVFGMTMKIDDSTSIYDETTQQTYIKQTLVVEEISSGSAVYGYLMVGDKLNSYTYNGETVVINRLYTVTDNIFAFKQNDTIIFNITRGGRDMNVTVTMRNTVEVN